jgi:rod shape-determining protein MreD
MRHSYLTYFILLLVAQLLICNFLHISPYLMLSILPILIFCLPSRISTPAAMIIAFATGLVVDLLSDGVLGLNAAALTPIAYIRKGFSEVVFGEQFNDTDTGFSVSGNGFWKVLTAVLVTQSIFLLIYFALDGAMARSFSFNLLRFVISLAAGVLISIPIADMIGQDTR